jgi:NAD-specific glutamate dehydrogenase
LHAGAGEQGLGAWGDRHAGRIARSEQDLAAIAAGGVVSVSRLSVAASLLSNLAQDLA